MRSTGFVSCLAIAREGEGGREDYWLGGLGAVYRFEKNLGLVDLTF